MRRWLSDQTSRYQPKGANAVQILQVDPIRQRLSDDRLSGGPGFAITAGRNRLAHPNRLQTDSRE